MTTRGLKEKDMILIAHLIDRALKNKDNQNELSLIKKEVLQLLKISVIWKEVVINAIS